MELHESKIACPMTLPINRDRRNDTDLILYHAIIGNNDVNEQILTNGYIRDCWNNTKEMQDCVYPPIYLIQIIENYYCDEVVHLFGSGHKLGHWNIKLNHILSMRYDD